MGIEDYIDSLPMALSNEEQNSLLRLFYATRREDIRQLLIEHNLRLVASCVMRYKNVYEDLDDLMTIGTLELINVIDNKFDINRGVTLSTFAVKSIKLRLLSEMNISSRSADVLNHFHENQSVSKDNEVVELLDFIPDENDFTKDIAFQDLMERFLDSLSEYEKYLLVHRLELGENEFNSYTDLGKKFNKSRMAVSSDVSSLINRLKEYLKTGKLQEEENKEEPVIEEKFDEISPEMQMIIDYVNTTNNDNHRFVLEHFYGLNGKVLMDRESIDKTLGLTKGYTSKILERLRKKGVIQIDDCGIGKEDVLNYISSSNNERDIQILEYYYGLNGNKKLSRKEIAELLGITYNAVLDRVYKLNGYIKKNKNKKANKLGIREKGKFLLEFCESLIDERLKLVFEHMYGLNSHPILNDNDIAKAVGCSKSHVYRLKMSLENKLKDFVEEKNKQEEQELDIYD